MPDFSILDLLKISVPMDFTVSPDGQECVYALRTLDEEKGEYRQKLWRTSTLPGEQKPVQLTYGIYNDTSPVYSPDGKWIAFLSDRVQDAEDEEDEEKPSRHLWLLPTKGGEARPIGEGLEEIYDFVFSPLGDCLFVIADAKKSEYEKQREKVIGEEKRDFTHEERLVRAKQICTIEIDTGKVNTIYQPDFGLTELAAAHSGKALVFATNHTGSNNDWDRQNLYLLIEENGTWRREPLVERIGACHSAAFSPDDRYIAYIAPRFKASEHSQSDVWLMAAKSGSSPVNVTETLGIVADAEGLQWTSSDSLLVEAEQGLYAPLIVLEGVFMNENGIASSAKWRCVSEPEQIVRQAVLCENGTRLVYRAEDANTPFELFSAAWPKGSIERITSVQDDWKDYKRADVREFSWESFDGKRMEGVLVLPSVQPTVQPTGEFETGPLPLVVDIHGGPAWHTTRGFSQYVNWHWLASLGYAVFAPNYRGGLAYGQEYLYANHEDLAGGDYRDIMAGVDAVVATGLIDPERLGVMGGSYGGYMTNWIIGHETRFKAAVSEFGIWNLMTDFGCSTQRSWEIMYLGRYWENEALYLERSPARYVTSVQTPVLIIHGDADDNTFIANSKEMYNALLEADKTVEFVHYPREGHGIREPRHREDELTKIRDWFWHYLPTRQTPHTVPLGEWETITEGKARVQFRVESVSQTTDFQTYGDGYEKLLAVTVSQSHNVSQLNDEAKFTLHIHNPSNENVYLAWRGNYPHQRSSILVNRTIAPIAVSLPGSQMLLTGEIAVMTNARTTFQLLFPVREDSAVSLEDWFIVIGGTKFLLK